METLWTAWKGNPKNTTWMDHSTWGNIRTLWDLWDPSSIGLEGGLLAGRRLIAEIRLRASVQRPVVGAEAFVLEGRLLPRQAAQTDELEFDFAGNPPHKKGKHGR